MNHGAGRASKEPSVGLQAGQCLLSRPELPLDTGLPESSPVPSPVWCVLQSGSSGNSGVAREREAAKAFFNYLRLNFYKFVYDRAKSLGTDLSTDDLIHKHNELQMLRIIWFVFSFLFTAAATAYGDSQAGGPIRAVAASLYQNHSNAGSKPCL